MNNGLCHPVRTQSKNQSKQNKRQVLKSHQRTKKQ